MSRSKKTASQKIVNVATTGMPSPVRKYMGSRIGAALIVLSMLLLLTTGVVTIKWENGRPRLSVNQQKAVEVKAEATEKIQELRDEHSDDRPGVPPGLVPHFGNHEASHTGFAADTRQDEGFVGKLGERAEELKERLGEDHAPTWNLAPAEQEGAAPQATGVSRLKQRFQRRR